MQHLPPEIITKIAFCLVDNLKWNELVLKIHVLTPHMITFDSIQNIYKLSITTSYLYHIIWESKYFWKSMIQKYFHTIKTYTNYLEKYPYKSLVKKALVLTNVKQCQKCYYFNTKNTMSKRLRYHCNICGYYQTYIIK